MHHAPPDSMLPQNDDEDILQDEYIKAAKLA